MDNDLFIYTNHINDLGKDFIDRFKYLLNREIPEWIISLFHVEAERENLEAFIKEEFIEIIFDLEVKYVHSFKLSE